MREVFYILFGAVFTGSASFALGSLLLRRIGISFHRFESALFTFVAGSGVLSLLVTLLCLVRMAQKGVFLALGAAAIAAAVWEARRKPLVRRTLPAVRLNWLVPFSLIFGALFIYYLVNALAPEVSPDGSGYHLGNVQRVWRYHGFDWGYRSMYAYLSQGLEMLFLFAFAFGKHSSAALVHLIFFCTLPWLIVCYGRRFGIAQASLFAALAVFASPVVAKDGVSAYNDLAVVTLIFAVFYLLQVWSEELNSKYLILIGFLSGYAYAVKYTAFLTLPFVLAWIWWQKKLTVGAVLRVGVPAAVLVLPWVLRNWIWVGNPVAPFANSWFPNAYYHPGMERDYVELLKHYTGIKHWWQIPLELTLRGGVVGGTFNPVFLMLPLSLLALRSAQGRRLLLTALVFAVPAWWNVGSRFLIPSSPFVAMALGLALQTIPAALPLAFAFAALVGWPSVTSMYCDPWNWRIGGFPINEALRMQEVEPYILKYLPDYALRVPIEKYVGRNERIFSFAGRPNAYMDRDIVVSYESALGNLVHDTLWAPQAHRPVIRERFPFFPVTASAVRVSNNTTSDDFWTLAEMRIYLQKQELIRSSNWRISAFPNAWEATLAFDNNYATRWSTWEPLRPSAHVQIEFPKPTRLDEVVLECDPAWKAKLEVDARLPTGRWVGLTDTAQFEKAEPPGGIRLAATRQVKRLGFRYLLINDGDFVYEDFQKYSKYWGITHLANVNGTHLYRID